MGWRKLGLIFKPRGEQDWMRSHAQVPTAIVLSDRIRVFITIRPDRRTSLATFIDLDPNDPLRILHLHPQPILPLGRPGTFDEFGIMPACVLAVGSETWLYTTGWSRGQTVPYLNAVGLAISRDGERFERAFEGPVLDRTRYEPYSTMSPYILRRDGVWHMWYGSGVDWIQGESKLEPVYYLKYASSTDGIDWHQPNHLCIPPRIEGEANTRPCVIHEDGRYKMWFSYRGSSAFRGGSGSYRIGYAESVDGKQWDRNDAAAMIEPSPDGWDSDMVAYPNVVDAPCGRLMFYNGNDFGSGGFGVAVWTNA